MDRFYIGFCGHCQEDVVFHNVSAEVWSCMTCGRTISIGQQKNRFAESMAA